MLLFILRDFPTRLLKYSARANLHSLKQIKTSNGPAQTKITETVVQKEYLKLLPCGTFKESSKAGFLTQHPFRYRDPVPDAPKLPEAIDVVADSFQNNFQCFGWCAYMAVAFAELFYLPP